VKFPGPTRQTLCPFLKPAHGRPREAVPPNSVKRALTISEPAKQVVRGRGCIDN